MTFRFIYQKYECNRIVPSVIIDNRANIPAVKNQIGDVIKAYTDSVTADIVGNDNKLFYKIETSEGHLVGFFCVNPGSSSGFITNFELRQNYQKLQSAIRAQIVNFVQSGEWKADQLT